MVEKGAPPRRDGELRGAPKRPGSPPGPSCLHPAASTTPLRRRSREVIAKLKKEYPEAPLFAVGWSNGANVLTNYLGEEGDATPLVAGVALCNPFDLVRGALACSFKGRGGAPRLGCMGRRLHRMGGS